MGEFLHKTQKETSNLSSLGLNSKQNSLKNLNNANNYVVNQNRISLHLKNKPDNREQEQLNNFTHIYPMKGGKISFLTNCKTNCRDDMIQRNTIWLEDIGAFFSNIFLWGNHSYKYQGFLKIYTPK